MKQKIDSKGALDIPNESFFELCQEQFPEKKLFIFEAEKAAPDFLTGKALAQKAKNLGQILQQKVASQEKALLLLPQGLEYIYSLLACFYANVIAVPIAVADIFQPEQLIAKINPILKDSQATCIITDVSCQKFLTTKPEFSSIFILDAADLSQTEPVDCQTRKQLPEDIAIFLYTSGSTAQPKGVMISHRNLMIRAFVSAIQWDIDQDSCIVSWLPQYHSFAQDFHIFSPMVRGACSVILTPNSFVKNPQDWFSTIDKYQATHTGAPNFAFDYCYSSINYTDLEGISLQSVKAIICGGEPVRKVTVENFYQKFKDLGLHKNTFSPTYGLSEMGTVVTLKPGQPMRFLYLDITSLEKGKVKTAEDKEKSKSVASCGEIRTGINLHIVHPESCTLCATDEVGEIWIKSPAIGEGYFNRRQVTEKTFGGTLRDTNEGGFLRTGDLGFIKNNHLYIVGREKEVIIIHGKNYHPVDIEWTIKEKLPEFTMPLAVFSCEIDQQDQVIVVQEMETGCGESEYKKVALDILKVVSVTHRLELYEINLVKKGNIPRTGSGKIQRKSCYNAYINHQLDVLFQYCHRVSGTQSKNQDEPLMANRDFLEIIKKEVLTPVLQISAERLELASSFNELGLDSIQYIRIAKQIEEIFKIEFNPVMLFECQKFSELTKYLASQVKGPQYPNTSQDFENSHLTNPQNDTENKIAIIGISCHFPGGAVDAEKFWENLVGQKDGITDIAESRPGIITDDHNYYGNTGSFPHWGGFIDDVAEFDASFFNISPLEAESMDPQQRKLLELTWSVIEDSGYNPAYLSGKDLGLFIGVHNNDYAELVSRNPGLMEIYGGHLDSGLHMSMIAHRVSRWFNFHGPSGVFNTACSSSLVAIHHALESIYRGECKLAIAGGINLILTSRIYRASHKAGMLSPDGHCKTFDQAADGFVRAEGYGAVLLKPLCQAIKDQDTIYGVIKGAFINHDGQSNSLRAPNLNAQKQLIKTAYQESGLPPETISYIETHGSGTPLGDPIEFQALREAFEEINPHLPKAFCGLSTVKTNIGHCESAAGIAGLIKVLLSMRQRTLPGILHFKNLNPYIQLEKSPFYIVEQTQEWKRLKNAAGEEIPRRAGISSFGFGGANAHVIVEEYIPLNKLQRQDTTKQVRLVIVLSAKNKERLKDQAQQLLGAIKKSQFANIDLTDIAYTLQVGREAMEERLGVTAGSMQELVEKLEGFIEGRNNIAELYLGQAKPNNETLALFAMDEELQEAVEKWFQRKKYGKLLELWVKGFSIDWNKLYFNIKPHRINLPTYPFTRECYWIPEIETKGSRTADTSITNKIHPLLHQNTSDLSEQRYSSTFSGEEFFLADHVVRGQKILSGVAHLEMARAAVELATGALKENRRTIKLKNVVWIRPVEVEIEPIQIHIGIYPEKNGEIAYEIYSLTGTDENEAVIYSQGIALLAENTENPLLDLEAIQAECSQSSRPATEVYDFFKAVGIDYGPGHQGIETIYLGQGLVLAKLSLPLSLAGTEEQFVLHPSIMDAALQASIGIGYGELESKNTSKLSLPFALQELEVFNCCKGKMWAVIKYSKGSTSADKVPKFDIDLLDEQGNVCVCMKGYSLRILEEGIGGIGLAPTGGSIMFEPVWKEQDVINSEKKNRVPGYNQQLVILCEQDLVTTETIKAELKGVRVFSLQSRQKSIAKRFQGYTVQVFEEIQKIFEEKPVGKVLVQIVITSWEEQQLFAGFLGLLKTVQLENPNVLGQLIEMEQTEDSAGLIGKLKENSFSPMDTYVRYQKGKRQVAGWSEVTVLPETTKIPWKDGGVYLITGGAGGLGMIFAKEIAEQVKDATLVLSGRSSLNANKQVSIKELEQKGAKITYRLVDVTDQKAVNKLIGSIVAEFGKLDGIIHCAGVIRDNYIIKKTKEELIEVLNSKVIGLENLDISSQDLSLDFMILFSSISGSLGNPGQADYAAANAFMDAYAGYRNTLVNSGKRYGRTISINWPLWQEGGMQVDAIVEKMMSQSMGIIALRTTTGIRALYEGIASGRNQVMVLEGDIRQIRATFSKQGAVSESVNTTIQAKQQDSIAVLTTDLLWEKTNNYLKKLLSPVIKLPAERIEADTPMEKYGIDSIMVMQLTNQLEKTFGSLSKTLFFEYQTIRELSGYFLESYREQIDQLIGIEKKEEVTIDTGAVTVAKPLIPIIRNHNRSCFTTLQPIQESKINKPLDIAIIGVSGKYPQAQNISEFWQNLRDGKDCITEIPKDRWDHSRYYDEDKNKPGKTYSKWGGFIDGVDQFDPLFFNISPREAEIMDPQERLFLQCVYETLEDAGYTRENLSKYQGLGLEGNIGVYVGVMYEEYQLYGAQAQVQGFPVALSGNPSSIANRVSYFCNFHGPSVAVDTMCSSSLTAIHLACQSIQHGGCELAIAGGVNVSIHPNKYLMLAQGKFASSKGRCESFGQGGDGYVPGEGVGAVLLKPLSKAIADGDQIYGVIRGTAVNHGGKTNGYSVPNPNVQAAVIGQALQEAGIDPRTISYIEAHGTGTSLGDPIEITGLSKTFQKYTKEQQFCAIGSAKSNIGHCESAAGIAGVTKVLLQLKHCQIVPSLHSEILNPHIDFLNTPFIVQQELTEWERPVITIDGTSKEYPRIAGISSFGAGGSNAHIVIEEYIPQDREVMPFKVAIPVIIVLSAKNEERLKEQVQQLLIAIREQQFTDVDISNIAYTLQMGREAMEERLAVLTSTMNELEEKLMHFVAGADDIPDLYHGQVKQNKETLTVITGDDDMLKTIDTWITKGKYKKLLQLWVRGFIFDWNKLYGSIKPHRISLPTYPFSRERYWVPKVDLKVFQSAAIIAAETPKQLISGNRRICFLKKQWEFEPATPNRKPNRMIAILTTSDTKEIGVLISKYFNKSCLFDINDIASLRPQPEQEWGKYDGIIDLVGCSDKQNESFDWIIWLQKLIEQGSKDGLMLLGVTRGLESFGNQKINSTGALRVGLYRMLQSEYSQLRSRHMDVDPISDYPEIAQQIVIEYLINSNDSEICYLNRKRYRAFLGEMNEVIGPDEPEQTLNFPEGHVLWITGGTRGLGYLCARHFITKYGVKRLVLTGREQLPPREEWDEIKLQKNSAAEKIMAIQAIEAQGVKVKILSVSLTDKKALQQSLKEIKNDLGPIGGLIHAAGRMDIENPAFIKKPVAGIKAVMEPKVNGLDILFQTIRQEPLQFFIMFSSASAIIPTIGSGQSDYAMANAYMDYFAEAYQSVSPIISIQWPNWKETGMGEVKSKAYEQTGLLGLTNAEGLKLLDYILAKKIGPVVLPAIINPNLWKAKQLMQFSIQKNSSSNISLNNSMNHQLKTSDILTHKIQGWLSELFANELKIDLFKMEPDKAFQDYGVDSVLLAQLIQKINQSLSEKLDPSILYEYSTIESFATWLARTKASSLSKFLDISALTGPSFEEPLNIPKPSPAAASIELPTVSAPSSSLTSRDIAVIGLSCRFPGANNIEGYWQLLSEGCSAIQEVPFERWGITKRYHAGLLDNITQFDPLFFLISEEDAKSMDPQALLLLEESLNLWHHAGYSLQEIKGKPIGVYIGGRSQHQPNDAGLNQSRNPILAVGQNYLAANISHFFDLRGPSLILDTACSSALVGMNMAIQALLNKEINMAMIGGVSLLQTDGAHQLFHQRGILSQEPAFHIFDRRAQGIVLGEGVGMVLLKTLDQALEDGDQIYAVIKGLAVNNDGRTAGPATPSLNAQKEVMQKALAKSGKQPGEINYIEVNGSGSEVTDLLELKAIQSIYRSSDITPLGLGSIKPNIGHPLCAEGIASFIKVVLMLYHKQMPPFLSGYQPMMHFNIEASPFYFSRKLTDWSNTFHIAALNCFADGGTNVHAILEAWDDKKIHSKRYPIPSPALNRYDIRNLQTWDHSTNIWRQGITEE